MSTQKGSAERPHLATLIDPAARARILGRMVGAGFAKRGKPPGVLIAPEKPPAEPAHVEVITYDLDRLTERAITDVDQIGEPEGVLWLNMDGVHDVALAGRIGEHFGFHPLLLEDVVSPGQRPKVEEYGDFLFIVLHMLTVPPTGIQVQVEQVSLVLGRDVLVTFQERHGDVFDPVRERLRTGLGRLRKRRADYLCYTLMDAVVDHYFGVLERLGEATESIDEELNERPGPDALRQIHNLKRELLILRKSVWPVREVLGSLTRNESGLIEEDTKVFLRDVYDHAIHAIDTTESVRDVIGGMSDLYLSLVGHRTNEVMRVLTVTASIFIPLTFLAGIYGMNFDVMPELHQPLAYPVLLGVMATTAIALLLYFKRRGWL